VTVYAIGDIQGCAAALDALLRAIRFSATHDQLWLVGDLVNRGPDSLRVMRRVIDLGTSAVTVLGNHDLHLLATAAGARAMGPQDTFQPVLDAADAPALVDWLRARPLVHFESEPQTLLVHAGLPPPWTVEQALGAAAEVERALRADAWQAALTDIYAVPPPSEWSPRLSASERLRYTVGALTRMRFCDTEGRLDFVHTGPPGTQAADLMPWFDAPGRAERDAHVIFGHWAALGFMRRGDVTALDSGCVWGGTLTALPVAPRGEPVSVSCPCAPSAGLKRPPEL
jgi:bis(5'-nucleosyl)-tetraphosphatase (symmetrical)